MKYLVAVLLLLVASFPANAILVDAANDAGSLALARTFPFMCCAALWDEEGGARYSGGSGTLVRNNPQDGAWILTAKHAIDDAEGANASNYIRYTFETSFLDAFPKGSSGYLPDKSIAVVSGKVFFHATQDIALAKLERLVRDDSGDLISPAELNSDKLAANQVVLFGGSGQIGLPSQSSPNGTGCRDGYKRCGRGIFDFLMGSEAILNFSRTVALPAIACIGDSGGFAAIERNEKIFMVGVLVTVYGSGEDADTAFETFSYDPSFVSWVNDTIEANSEPVSCVTEWLKYQ